MQRMALCADGACAPDTWPGVATYRVWLPKRQETLRALLHFPEPDIAPMTTFDELPTHIRLEKHYALTQAITHALSQFIAETNPFILFGGLLDKLLTLTESEYGFIGEAHYDEAGQPYIQCYATTDIAWSDKTRELYRQTAAQGMRFTRLNSLYGEVLKTGRPVISNAAASDSRSGGLPEGHPALKQFLGLPFYHKQAMVGVIGIANRRGGYDASLIAYLGPFIDTCGNLIHAYHNNQQAKLIEKELDHYKKQLGLLAAGESQAVPDGRSLVPLGNGYVYQPERKGLLRYDKLVPLTKKESLLLSLLVSRLNQPVGYREIEDFVWQGVIVSESSLRGLVLRLRHKVPSLQIRTISGVGLSLTV